MKLEVRGRVRIHPTEDAEKVKKAILQVIANPAFSIHNNGKFQELVFTAKSLDAMSKMKVILARDQIRDAVRNAFLSSLNADVFEFYLNKQVAYAGHISFCQPSDESPLGPIHIIIATDEPTEFLDWIAPSLEQRKKYRKHAAALAEDYP